MNEIASIYQAALAGIRGLTLEPEAAPLSEPLAQLAAAMRLPAGEGLFEAAARADARTQGMLLWNLNKMMDSPTLRGMAAARVAERLRPLGPSTPPDPGEGAQVLKRDGILAPAGMVSSAEAAQILAHMTECKNLTPQETVLHHDPADVVRAPHVFRIATDERLLALAYHHLGAPPSIVQMDCWWSLPGDGVPMGAQVFHRDRDDFRACKLFVYLSEVTPDNGPHIFVRGSHNEAAVRDALTAKGIHPDKAQKFFARSGRDLAAAVEDIFGPAVTEVTGPPGTCFLENTYGLHRGKVPVSGRRCVFQVLYAAVPYPDRLAAWKKAGLNALPHDCSDTPLARAATRFILH